MDELPDDFCSLLGKVFLSRIFYPELFKVSEVALCVADKKEVLGFVIFSSDKSFLRRLAINHFFIIIRYSLPHIFRIGFLRYLFEVIILLFSNDDRLHGCELSYIALSKDHQGQGFGEKLLKKGLSELSRKGNNYCWVKTLSTTSKSIRFYEKIGFELLKVQLGRTYFAINIDTDGK